ncbi:Aminomethyltransferase folate-binding domain [Popillia japonica]|uniref:Aminomethyltransferase n=1 Tax=Popillia japonica TaxID=7064 RepID=A0AAW1MFV0_POPJA
MFSKSARQLVRRSRARYYSDCSETGAKTALYDFHVENGGKMVNFAGYSLPVQYGDHGIVKSHLFTRSHASLFDVSHMLQTEVRGNDSAEFIESVCTADLENLQKNSAGLAVFTNEKGGILDDLIVTKIGYDHLYLVSNAARREHDQKLLMTGLEIFKCKYPKADVRIQFFQPRDRSLLAIQGPKSAEILQKFTTSNLSRLFFMKSTIASVCGVELCRVTRCGYTGEDGFEISLPSVKAVDVAREILTNEDVKLAGLGARDSLRLEAGLCLYGTDITEETTPVEAALSWLISKRRRRVLGFPGSDIIINQINDGSIIKRIGIIFADGPPARQGSVILDESGGKVLGSVTSGCPAPSLGRNIAMAYVPVEFSKPETKLCVKIRDKLYNAVVVKMPFVQTRYYLPPK